MDNPTPLVSVLMPVYNSARYLSATVESILTQTFSDLELIAVNDGSTDNSLAILEEYQQRDERVRIHTQANQGIPTTRNKCLELATGKYIVWIDSDDIAVPQRIEKQVAFMENNPDIGACGTWLKTFGAPPHSVWRYPTDSASIRSTFIFNPPCAPASTIVRRTVVEQNRLQFNLDFKVAQDYEFLSRLAKYCQFANLPEVLYLYRLHTNQVTQIHNQDLRDLTYRVQSRYFEQLGLQLSDDDVNTHVTLTFPTIPDSLRTPDFIEKTDQWLQKLRAANQKKAVFPEPAFSSILAQRWFFTCRQASHLGWWAWRRYWQSPLSQHYNIRFLSKAKFFVFSSTGRRKA